MKRYIVLDKKVGETPLEAIEKWKRENPDYAQVKASYAGRLDPMASGKLLVLLGEECKRQKEYTGLDKEYEIEVLLGVGSDTGDALGKVSWGVAIQLDKKKIDAMLARECGAHSRAYPIFSSKTVKGKPLFLYALEGTISSIEIPTHIEHIYTMSRTGVYTLSQEALQSRIQDFLRRVPSTDEVSKKLGDDFRIEAVRAHWEEIFKEKKRTFAVIRLRVVCASGTYMRSLAGRVGEALGTRALALSISRTSIGKYVHFGGSIGWWLRKY